MKKVFVFVFLWFLLSAFAIYIFIPVPRGSNEQWAASQEVKVHSAIAGEWIYFNNLLIEYGVDMDYSQINEIRVTDLTLLGSAGFYDLVTHNIYVDYCIESRKEMFIVLAHEVAHSQGAEHEFGDVLMNPYLLESTAEMDMSYLEYYIIGVFSTL